MHGFMTKCKIVRTARAINGVQYYTMIEFYNVKKKQKVSISEADVEKKSYERKLKSGKTSIRYALKAVDDDGTKLTKFCSKADYDKLPD